MQRQAYCFTDKIRQLSAKEYVPVIRALAWVSGDLAEKCRILILSVDSRLPGPNIRSREKISKKHVILPNLSRESRLKKAVSSQTLSQTFPKCSYNLSGCIFSYTFAAEFRKRKERTKENKKASRHKVHHKGCKRRRAAIKFNY